MEGEKTKKKLIVLIGPTSVGKTDLAIALARELSTEIVSADARQVYQKLTIGTAKPTLAEQAAAKHHLIDFLPLESYYSAGDFEKDAMHVLAKIWQKSDYAILAGGSGLYIDAVCKGLTHMPATPPEVRAQISAYYKIKGTEGILAQLKKQDPFYFAKVDQKNPRRILRALEVIKHTEKPFSSFLKTPTAKRPFNIVKIGLTRPREELYERINLRVDLMIQKGLLEEVKTLLLYKDLPVLHTIGYQEFWNYLAGKEPLSEAIRILKRNTRHYAKRQFTYFRKDATIHWVHPKDMQEIINLARSI